MNTLRVYPQESPLRGTVRIPGDKSISHRAVILAALAQGESLVRGWLPAGDTRATLNAMRALGVGVEVLSRSPASWDLVIVGRGLRGLQEPVGPLDCQNAGTCMRLLAGLLAGQQFASVLVGSAQLSKRPMRRIVEPLRQMGARIEANDNRAPLQIRPSPLHGIDYRLPVASAQVKSAVLLAGLYATGTVRVKEPGPARDHTERMLQALGVDISSDAGWIVLQPPNSPLSPLKWDVPGDISSAAFPLVAAALVPQSRVTLLGVGTNPTRTGILELLGEMGAELDVENRPETGGEPIADVTAGAGELQAVRVGGDQVVRAIDEFPVWAVAAACANGLSRLQNAAELRVKEVDRIEVLAGELRGLGLTVETHPDGLSLPGPQQPVGGVVDSHGDHRLAMALAIAGLLAREPTTVQDASCIGDSFPSFVETMRQLGAHMEWVA